VHAIDLHKTAVEQQPLEEVVARFELLLELQTKLAG